MRRKTRSSHNLDLDEVVEDSRLARRLKRRFIANQEFKRLRTDSKVKLDKSHNFIPKAKANNVVIDHDDKELEDADYVQYLNNLSSQTVDDIIFSNNVVDSTNLVDQPMGNCSSGNFSTSNITAGGFVETSSQSIGADGDDYLDEIDLHYKTFLDNVIEIGTSYALEIPGCDGISEILTYEDYEKDDVQDAARVTKHVPKHNMKCDEVDSSYSNFLDSLKKEGKNLVLMLENGGKVVYEEDEESSSDSDVIVMDTDPFADENCTPFVTSKGKIYEVMDEDDECRKSCINEQSWFREKLVEILKKPFDEEEYFELLSQVRQHKPVKEERGMRNGRTRVYLSHKIAPSYCDLHKDLETCILLAGHNKPKILSILRGFFYWLQNVAHDGVFKPWTDSACLEVLPSVPNAELKSKK